MRVEKGNTGGGAEGKSKKEETKPGDKGSEKDTREKQMK